MKPASKSFKRVRSSLDAARGWVALFGRWVERRPTEAILNLTEGLRTIGLEKHTAQLSAETLGRKQAEESLRQSKAQMEAGKLTLEERDFNLHSVLEGTLGLLAQPSQSKGIELVGFIENSVPVRLRGDAGRIQQVLLNLVGNAIKFTQAGEVTVRISRELEDESQCELRFKVTDTGIGFAPETQKTLSEAFSQAGASTTRKFSDTGMGLAIARQLVKKMGGQIGLESALGKGSTFWFTVRLHKSPASHPPFEEDLRLVDRRVLVVDDNAASCQFLQEQIIGWKMRSNFATTATDALEYLRKAVREGDSYPLAIIDLEMPDMGGLELARKIKADPEIVATRLILLAGFDSRIPAEELSDQGFVDRCFKPVPQSMLFDCVANALLGSPTNSPVGSPAPPRPQLQTTRVLIAEDNAVNQEVALGQLKQLGYTADAVSSGLAVLEALDRTQYDIVLMDCQMPGMDGYEATRRICASNGKFPVPYIIAMTAHAMEGDSEKCLAAGMNDYVSKPVVLETLAAALARGQPSAPVDDEAVTPEIASVSDESALSKQTLQELKELGSYMGAEFFPKLLSTFEHDTAEHLAALRAATAGGETEQVRGEAHALKGASLTIGALGMAQICLELERFGTAQSMEGVPEELVRLEREFDRVKIAIKQESIIP